MRRCAADLLLIAIVLAGCSNEPLPVSLQPTLHCAAYIKCHVIAWQLGWRPGSYIGGTHLTCTCTEASND